MMENTNKQLKRRAKVIGIFPSEKSLLSLACALLMEIDELWDIASLCYIDPEKSRKFLKDITKTSSSD